MPKHHFTPLPNFELESPMLFLSIFLLCLPGPTSYITSCPFKSHHPPRHTMHMPGVKFPAWLEIPPGYYRGKHGPVVLLSGLCEWAVHLRFGLGGIGRIGIGEHLRFRKAGGSNCWVMGAATQSKPKKILTGNNQVSTFT